MRINPKILSLALAIGLLASGAKGQAISPLSGGGGGTPGGSSGQVQYNNAGALGGFTLSGDGTLNTGTGALTVTKINGSTPGAAALLGVGAGLSSSGGNIVLGDGVGFTYNATTPGISITGGSVAASAPVLQATQTWSTTGTYVLDTINVTNSGPANAASTLINRSVGGVSQFSVTRAGNVNAVGTIAGNVITGTALVQTAGAAGAFSFTGSTRLVGPTNGQLTITDALTTSLGVIQVNFGGATSAFPAWKRAALSTILAARLADDSTDAPITALTIKTAGFTVGALPAAGTAGRRAYVTDQLTTCAVAGAALTGGGAVVCPVFDNGVAWVGD